MRHTLLVLLVAALLAGAEYDDFDFDASSFEKEPFSWQGHLRSDNSAVRLRAASEDLFTSSNELNLKADYEEVWINLYAEYSAYYRYSDSTKNERQGVLNALYQRFGDEHNSLSLGKEVLRWGKGYAYSPLAFFERPKDPLYPELSREGYWMAHAQMTRTFENPYLQNATLSLVALPDNHDNASLFAQTDSHYGSKLYMLLGETDIDLVVAQDAWGADISANAAAGLELHGEYARKQHNESYLVGLRYQSATDLTLIAEYAKDFRRQQFAYAKLSQKEPLGIVYSTLYLLGTQNHTTDTYRILAGGTYDFKNGLTLDAALQRSSQGQGIKAIVHYYF